MNALYDIWCNICHKLKGSDRYCAGCYLWRIEQKKK